MPPRDFECKRCGRCCDGEHGPTASQATEEDMAMWIKNGRHDIIAWVDTIELGGVACARDIWIDPDTGDDAERCPWLRETARPGQYECTIYDLKPEVCRGFPHTREQAAEYGCPGFEHDRNPTKH